MRLRGFRGRVSRWQTRVRRAATLALVTAGIATTPAILHAQMGQTAMAPAGGLVNRAVAGFQGLNDNGPGVLYYGINAADRGLGYVGSYMTLGGFVPMFEDDLGGFWSADLRGHLSVYGGLFSNVGAVRKQFIGGTLLGVGVYWDYDGDLNQYSDTVIPSVGQSFVFPGGQVYNQVGVSGEWLTDYGNLRSNGYIPVGTTGQLAGPFVGNSILCVNGINAALGGADLEVGAYIPSLADWAGMISVGGYALGNTRYQFPDGADAVPWFGGVYTRLDLTFVENWDFSLQANNDSYFDWTGFARLTYRMGGSRRRNVSDQVEQPMMRNEHIVRAHQAPIVATNPNNVDAAGMPQAWQVFHVDNTASAGGDGTAEAPFRTLADARAAAVSPWDIVYVRVGDSYANPYLTPMDGYSFNAANQYLIGEGSSLPIPTVSCGNLSLLATSQTSLYPQITNPVGAAITIDQPGVTVNHVQVANSNVGITDGNGLTAPGVATISDVIISGTQGPFQRGVEISKSDGTFNFDNVRLADLGNDGFVVSAANGDVNISNSSLTNILGLGVLASGPNSNVDLSNTTVSGITGIALVATGDNATITATNSTIRDTQGIIGQGARAEGDGSRIELTDTTITNSTGSALVAAGNATLITATRSEITGIGGPGISISGDAASVILSETDVSGVTGAGVVVGAANSAFLMDVGSTLTAVSQNGIEIADPEARAYVLGGSAIARIGGDGILSQGGTVHVRESSIQTVGGAGLRADQVDGTKVILVQGSSISGAADGGILATDSNLRVERLDPLNPRSTQTAINGTGPVAIRATLSPGAPKTMSVLVDGTRITGADVGIDVAAGAGTNPAGTSPENVIDFTATNNQIVTNANGTGIALSAVFNTDLEPPVPGTAVSRVRADIRENQITTGANGTPILLTTVGGPTQDNLGILGIALASPDQKPLWLRAGGQVPLQNLNNGAEVTEVPEPQGEIQTSVNYDPGIAVATPPPPPPIPPPPAP